MNSGVYRNSGNTDSVPGPIGYIVGKGVMAQLLLALVICVILYILLMSIEIFYKSFKQIKGTRVALLDMTVNAENKRREFEQNPSVPGAKLIPMSDNERTGAEFSYSFFIYINNSSFRQEDALLHIMHKGNPLPFPLMAPGVFLRSNQNTLRVYMNSSKTWNNYIDVENIPVKKWVHVALVGRANAIEIYINGNLAKKLNLDGGVFYQNFGNLILFSPRTCVINPINSPSAGQDILQILGAFSGLFSNLYYYSYALSYTEIQKLLAEGPSSRTESGTEDAPPYLEDSWWVSNYST
jgi:hypothetical protein